MSKPIVTSKHGKEFGLGPDREMVVPAGYVAGGHNRAVMYYPSPNRAAAIEDFIGSVDDTGKPFPGGYFRAVVGDTGHTNSIQDVTNGVFRLFSATTAVTAAAANGAGISGGSLQWAADQEKLRAGARVKLESVSRTAKRVHVFFGFTDIASYEFPAYDTGAGFINNASDFVGLYFGAGADTGWSGVSKKSTSGDSGIQVVALDTGVAANVYDDIEVELNSFVGDTGGKATFFINGVPVGSIASPVSTGVNLCPVMYAFQQDTGGDFVDVDWVAVSALRDSGD